MSTTESADGDSLVDSAAKCARGMIRELKKHGVMADTPDKAYFNGFLMGASLGQQYERRKSKERNDARE